MENETSEVEVINKRLPFEPVCPKCGTAIDIKCGPGGYFARCENCTKEWSAYRSEDTIKEMEWLSKFNIGCKKTEETIETDPQNPPATKVFMEIARSSEVLRRAYELVSQAYNLINNDKVARKYINFNAKVTWTHFVWKLLNDLYDEDHPGNNDVYHLRAFDFYGVQPGMMVGDGECEGSCG